ncbi:hypothetical protein MKS88_002132 [Plasmodium brasilianum]|uniref:Uncharacterized protein n=1 Tax=Plasmodium brasilianum TaxID=5824 RepID=A0ACB9YBQ3_PLABR|nr:hypothetical protein MKS88_002132 [Plasmodium brasilianum]
MNNICTTVVAVNILEFFPWLDDLFKLMYLNKEWRYTVLDVIRNTNFLNGKTIMRLKNKKYILLILKYMKCNNKRGKAICEHFDRIDLGSYKLCYFPNVLELIIASCNLNPLFFNCIQHIFPRLIYFKLIIRTPVCIPLLKNFCFNSKSLRVEDACKNGFKNGRKNGGRNGNDH